MVASDGGIFNFSRGPFFGSLGDGTLPEPIVERRGRGVIPASAPRALPRQAEHAVADDRALHLATCRPRSTPPSTTATAAARTRRRDCRRRPTTAARPRRRRRARAPTAPGSCRSTRAWSTLDSGPGLDALRRAATACASCAAAARAARRTTARARRRSRRRRARRAAAASCHSSSRYTSCTTCSLNGNAVPRSCASVVFATAQPLCSAPTRWSSGTNTSSKNTSLNSASPVICTSGRTSMPGACMSTTRYEMPLCFGASGSVRARQMPQRGELRVATSTPSGPRAASRRRRGTAVRLQRREVGARVGLAEQLAPDLVGGEDRRQPALPSARRCRARAASGPARLMPTRLIGCSARDRAYSMLKIATSHRRRAPAAVRLGPVDADPAARPRAAPATRRPELDLVGDRLEARRDLDVRREPRAHLARERVLLGGEREVHRLEVPEPFALVAHERRRAARARRRR